VGEVLVGVTCRPRERSGTTPWQERVGERDVVGSACGLGLRLPRGLRATSFGLMLVHKPAYEFRWGETVVGRSSYKLFLLFFWASGNLAYLLC
jgi:hypothetical protein